MTKRVTANDRSLIGKRLQHGDTVLHVRAAWVDIRPGHGEKYLLLYNPRDRHAWDLSDDVDVGAAAVAAQYVDHGFAVSVEAGKRIMSGAAARVGAVAPAEMLERARALPVDAGRATPRAGARPLTAPAVTAASAAAAARRGRNADADTDTENIPGGYSSDHDEEEDSDDERHPMDDDEEEDPAPAAPAAAAPPAAPPAAAADDESDSDVCDEEAFVADPGWDPRNRRTASEHDAARPRADRRFHRDVRGGPTTKLGADDPVVMFFQEQFPPAMQSLIVDQTNLYAAQHIANFNAFYSSGNRCVDKDDERVMRDWTPLTRDELMKFVGVLIYMGVVGLRCVYCSERAESAVRNGLGVPLVSTTSSTCSICVRMVVKGCSAQLPLCVKPRPGLKSCFVMYHEEKHSRERSATALLAMG